VPSIEEKFQAVASFFWPQSNISDRIGFIKLPGAKMKQAVPHFDPFLVGSSFTRGKCWAVRGGCEMVVALAICIVGAYMRLCVFEVGMGAARWPDGQTADLHRAIIGRVSNAKS
jgi:hypothetical protein